MSTATAVKNNFNAKQIKFQPEIGRAFNAVPINKNLAIEMAIATGNDFSDKAIKIYGKKEYLRYVAYLRLIGEDVVIPSEFKPEVEKLQVKDILGEEIKTSSNASETINKIADIMDSCKDESKNQLSFIPDEITDAIWEGVEQVLAKAKNCSTKEELEKEFDKMLAKANDFIKEKEDESKKKALPATTTDKKADKKSVVETTSKGKNKTLDGRISAADVADKFIKDKSAATDVADKEQNNKILKELTYAVDAGYPDPAYTTLDQIKDSVLKGVEIKSTLNNDGWADLYRLLSCPSFRSALANANVDTRLKFKESRSKTFKLKRHGDVNDNIVLLIRNKKNNIVTFTMYTNNTGVLMFDVITWDMQYKA